MTDFSEAEIDALVEADDALNTVETRGRAYKRLQCRNKKITRNKDAKNVWHMPVKDVRKAGMFAKQHFGCNKARCKICHYGKIFHLPTAKDLRADAKMKDELADLYSA